MQGSMIRIRPVLLACAALLTLDVGSVGAADLGVQPVYKAGTPAAPLTYDWRGFYVGAHVGGTNAKVDSAIIDIATALPAATNSSSTSGVFGGGQFGYNFMATPNWLLGVEADISGAGLRSNITEALGATIANDARKIDLFGTARGRVGYAAGNWLFYATGGYAWMNTTATRSQLAGTINAAIPGTVESASAAVGGWAAGAGIEWGITPNVSIKAEYLHYDFQNTRFVFPLANRRWEDNTVKDSVKIGVNWRLNWGP
jgi:opacity protein-like surface antigen